MRARVCVCKKELYVINRKNEIVWHVSDDKVQLFVEKEGKKLATLRFGAELFPPTGWIACSLGEFEILYCLEQLVYEKIVFIQIKIFVI